MGFETVVYGYILLDPAHREHNRGVLTDYPFDVLYPFRNIFSEIRTGYGGDVVSFAGSFKSLDDECVEWEARFEGLQPKLYGRTAQVHLDHEADGMIKTVGYLCEAGWETAKALQERSWIKWYSDRNGRQGDKVAVIP